MPMKRIYETLNNVEDIAYMSSGTVKYKKVLEKGNNMKNKGILTRYKSTERNVKHKVKGHYHY